MMLEKRNKFNEDVDLNEATSLTHLLDGHQWRSEGGGICPRAPPGGGRQNHAKDFF